MRNPSSIIKKPLITEKTSTQQGKANQYTFVVASDAKRDEIAAAFAPLARARGIELIRGGAIDRRALGSILFASPQALALQESIVHPAVERRIEGFIAARPAAPCVINAAVLYKTPALLARCGAVLFVDAPALTRLLRVRKRNRLPYFRILERIRSQRKLFAQYARICADTYRVWNSGTLVALENNIDAFLAQSRKEGSKLWNKNE